MFAFRRLLADRSSALAAMLILVQVVLFQGVGALFACAASDAAAATGAFVICHDAEGGTGEAPSPAHDCCTDCQCAIACAGPGAFLTPHDATRPIAVAPAAASVAAHWTPRAEAFGPRAPPPGLPLQRGPPHSSI